MSGPAVEVLDVSKRFGLRDEPAWTLKERVLRLGRRAPVRDFWALERVSIEVQEGETLGLIGHNGSGKSTLLKCIGGILQPTTGEIRTRGRLASLLELGAGFHGDLTGRENVFLNGSILGLSRRQLEARFDEIVHFAELERFIDNPVKTYSSGMFVRLGFAVAVNVDPDILLVDEVLAVGDEAFQNKCLDRVREFQREGRTIVFVTHGVETVRQICDRAAVLNSGRLVAIGDPDECIRRYRDTLLNRATWYDDADDEPGDPAVLTSARAMATQLVRIEQLSVERADGAIDEPVRPGDAVQVHLDWVADETVDDVAVSFMLFDQDGHTLYGSNSDQLGQPIGPLRGSGRMSFLLGSLPLLKGAFTLSLGFHTHDGAVVHDFAEHRLDVDSEGTEAGMLDLRPKLVERERST
ncbi:MAG: ABC transporter ATP-binding protein [Actinomycetota bacterium]